MLTPENAATDGLESTDLAERLRAATAFLELIAANRGLLAEVPAEDRRRFLDAAAHVYSPDAKARRKLVKATIRLRKAARVQRDESELNETGIRQLRTSPGPCATPLPYAPAFRSAAAATLAGTRPLL